MSLPCKDQTSADTVKRQMQDLRHKSGTTLQLIQSNLDYPDSLGPHEIVRIIENMDINEEQN